MVPQVDRLVCVEAGVSLDAAILRVGREMLALHPELSYEFLMMNRRMNAGMRREDLETTRNDICGDHRAS